MTRAVTIVVKISAVLPAIALALVQFATLFNRQVEGDHVAYALPAANLAELGRLAIPQVGSQFALDRYWRFNSPFLGLGPAPWFAVFGISQWTYLLGGIVAALVGAVTFIALVRIAVGPRRWAVILLISTAFLMTRIYLSELYNQRYTVVAYAAVAALYFPTAQRGSVAVWKWALAGSLPLIHPALLVGSVVWVVAELGATARSRLANAIGLVLFALGVAACAVWYLDPEPLRTQFLPHLASRAFSPFSGWEQPASRILSLPSQTAMAMTLAAVCVWGLSRPRTAVPGAWRIVVLLAIVVLMDAFGYMFYLSYYLIGLGPAALKLLTGLRVQNWTIAALALLGVVNLAVSAKLDRPLIPDLPISQAELDGFIMDHTRPGDVIVLGPPFIFQTLTPWTDRQTPYVVPMPLYLNDFDQNKYLALLRQGSVYVGEPEYYTAVQRYFRGSSPPVFEQAEIAIVQFRERAVMIARQTASGRGKE
jgi:hypothetical protein